MVGERGLISEQVSSASVNKQTKGDKKRKKKQWTEGMFIGPKRVLISSGIEVKETCLFVSQKWHQIPKNSNPNKTNTNWKNEYKDFSLSLY